MGDYPSFSRLWGKTGSAGSVLGKRRNIFGGALVVCWISCQRWLEVFLIQRLCSLWSISGRCKAVSCQSRMCWSVEFSNVGGRMDEVNQDELGCIQPDSELSPSFGPSTVAMKSLKTDEWRNRVILTTSLTMQCYLTRSQHHAMQSIPPNQHYLYTHILFTNLLSSPLEDYPPTRSA